MLGAVCLHPHANGTRRVASASRGPLLAVQACWHAMAGVVRWKSWRVHRAFGSQAMQATSVTHLPQVVCEHMVLDLNPVIVPKCLQESGSAAG